MHKGALTLMPNEYLAQSLISCRLNLSVELDQSHNLAVVEDNKRYQQAQEGLQFKCVLLVRISFKGQSFEYCEE